VPYIKGIIHLTELLRTFKVHIMVNESVDMIRW